MPSNQEHVTIQTRLLNSNYIKDLLPWSEKVNSMEVPDSHCPAKPHILVVEDMGVHVRLIQLALQRANYEVTAVPDGNTALTHASQEPDLILLDVDIPGLNGFQVLDRLRSDPKTEHIPVIMLTAHAKDARLFEEWARPTDVFMTKPFAPLRLLATVKRVLAAQSNAMMAPPQ